MFIFDGAEGETRTRTDMRPLDPESISLLIPSKHRVTELNKFPPLKSISYRPSASKITPVKTS
jgi:hypothetical protein